MDVADVKKQKQIAQSKIGHILNDLHVLTGVCPMEVKLEIIDRTTMMDEERQYSVGMVKITMEAL